MPMHTTDLTPTHRSILRPWSHSRRTRERRSWASRSPPPSKWHHQNLWPPRECQQPAREDAQLQERHSLSLHRAAPSSTAAIWTRPVRRPGTSRQAKKHSTTCTCGSTHALIPSGCHPTSSCTPTWTTMQPPWLSSDSVSLVWRRSASGDPSASYGRDHCQSTRFFQKPRSRPRAYQPKNHELQIDQPIVTTAAKSAAIFMDLVQQ